MAALLSHQDHPAPSRPDRFRCAVFPAAGAPLELVEVEYRSPAKGTITLKVEACFLSQNDAIGALGLRAGHDLFPVTPGQCVVGRVVEVGAGAREGGGAGNVVTSLLGKLHLGGGSVGEGEVGSSNGGSDSHHKFKPGELVIAAVTHQGLAEYCTAHGTSTCVVAEGVPLLEQAVIAVFGGRVLSVCERYKRDLEHKSEEELTALGDACPSHVGRGCSGVIVVWGCGGHARLAYHLLRAQAPHERVVIVSPSDKHSHLDYAVPKDDFLRIGQVNLDEALRKLGGVKLAVCVDQPGDGFRDLLDATCPGAEVSLVSINGHGQQQLQVPVGPVIARSLVVRGLPALMSPTMHHAVRLGHHHELARHVSVCKFAFDVEGVRECYRQTLEPATSFDANSIAFGGEAKPSVAVPV